MATPEARSAVEVQRVERGVRRRAGVFWAGVVASTLGAALHLPMYFGAREHGYRMAGMEPDAGMYAGMGLIVVGLAATTYGLLPRRVPHSGGPDIQVRALDDTPIRPAHLALLVTMAIAITIDVMKPTTLAFVLPGVAREYGLRSPLNPDGSLPVALLPLVGIAGTVIGSFVWGWLGDRIGRRASILLAGVIFVVTGICGAMPAFSMNLVMCFVMGLGAGGMLPITFALMAETIPARHRGWVMVLIGGDVVGAYIITSWLAAELLPGFGWRILWLVGIPTGVLLIALNRWIPESPRFLLAHGRHAEARVVMARYGAAIVDVARSELSVEGRVRSRFSTLFSRNFAGLSAALVLLGLGIGLVMSGFQLWLPSNLQKLGFTEVTADRILRDSALIGFPLNFLVAWAYGAWSSRKTMILLTSSVVLSLAGFAILGDAVAENRLLLYALLVAPIWGASSVIGVLISYAAEVYPTKIRSRGSGLAAGASKAGGVLVIALVVAAVAPPSITGMAILGAVPLGLAALAFLFFGVDTQQRRLEEITAEELGVTRPVPAAVAPG